MRNKLEEHEDQATQLKNIFKEVQQNYQTEDAEKDILFDKAEQVREIDILNLPSRKEVHSKVQSRTKLKIGKPFKRFLFVIIILIALFCGAYYIWQEEFISIFSNL